MIGEYYLKRGYTPEVPFGLIKTYSYFWGTVIFKDYQSKANSLNSKTSK
jgi:hypothetical protein